MRRFERFVKQIALALVITLLVPILAPAAKVSAAETKSSWTVEMGENSYLEYEETETVRTAVYYENKVALQRAEYNLETGEILYYDLSKNISNNKLRNIDGSKGSAVVYHVSEFEREKVNKVGRTSTYALRGSDASYNVLNRSGTSYSYLKSYSFVDNGVTYNRSLYGAKSTVRYRENYWFFEAGVAITAISVLLGNTVSFIVQLGLAVGGVLISAISVEDWIKDSFWNYRFNQTRPNSMSFYCDEFLYRREKLRTINENDEAEWTLVYEKSAWDIELERIDILENPAKYY